MLKNEGRAFKQRPLNGCCEEATVIRPRYLSLCLWGGKSEFREGAVQTIKYHFALFSPCPTKIVNPRETILLLRVSLKSVKTFEHQSMLKSITNDLVVKLRDIVIKGCGVPKLMGVIMVCVCARTRDTHAHLEPGVHVVELHTVEGASVRLGGIQPKPFTHLLQNKCLSPPAAASPTTCQGTTANG